MPVEAWFPVPIFFEQLPEGPLLGEMLPHLYKISEGRDNSQPRVTGDAYSGSNSETAAQYLFLYPQLRPLFDEINSRVTTFAKQLGIDLVREHLYLGRSWVNILRSSGRVEPHNHMAAVISGVLYLQTPEESTLRFVDPKAPVRKDPLYAAGPNPFNHPHVDYRVKEGVLLLFPGYLTHGMRTAHTSDRERVSLSFDYYSVSLSGQSAPPPPRALVEKLWKSLEEEVKGRASE